MKKLLFFICFAYVILYPSFMLAEVTKQVPPINLSYKKNLHINHIIKSVITFNENYIFSDIDDEIGNSERKSSISQKTVLNTLSLSKIFISGGLPKKFRYVKNLFFDNSPLFIFISSFRL